MRFLNSGGQKCSVSSMRNELFPFLATRARRLYPRGMRKHEHADELPPFAWPAMLVFVLCAGLVGGALMRFLSLKSHRSSSGVRVSGVRGEAATIAEALVAIFSGALLWIGWWDVLDSYLVPAQWWAKMCMLLVGLIGLFATRSLYDRSAFVRVNHDIEGTSACEDATPLPPALPAELSPRHLMGQKEEASGPWDQANDRSCCYCLQPPPFSFSSCTRALVGTFAGLTMYVGLWDLIDDHILPSLFEACGQEPSLGCASVKLSLVGVGAIGLYVTRSLYGEQGVAVQFQRL